MDTQTKISESDAAKKRTNKIAERTVIYVTFSVASAVLSIVLYVLYRSSKRAFVLVNMVLLLVYFSLMTLYTYRLASKNVASEKIFAVTLFYSCLTAIVFLIYVMIAIGKRFSSRKPSYDTSDTY